MSLLLRRHGANPEKLYEAMGIAMPETVVDFSTNTNVLPWGGELDFDLRRCLGEYPDDEATELRSVLAAREGCSPENILVLNGSNEGVYLCSSFLADRTVSVLQPVYGEYGRALDAYGAKVRHVFSAVTTLEDSAALFLCNPCNPTGDYIQSSELEALFIRHPQVLFVVDEAYRDFLAGADRALNFPSYPNLVILRSLTKIYHLCGARIGYILSCEEQIERLKARRPTWTVNSVAQAAALAFLRDDGFIGKTRAFYAAETPRFMNMIEKTGLRVRPTLTNFFLVEVEDDGRVIRALLQRGIVVRHTRNFPGLDGRYIRVATRMPEENEMLAKAFREIIGQK